MGQMNKGVLIGIMLLSLSLGVLGATLGTLYQRHNTQHWNMEQALQRQEQINREFAQALNGLLGARKP